MSELFEFFCHPIRVGRRWRDDWRKSERAHQEWDDRVARDLGLTRPDKSEKPD